MVRHHEVFSRFKPFSGEVPPYWHLDFLGTKIRHEYIAGYATEHSEPYIVGEFYPGFDEEYFEWVDLLESVVAARGSYNMLELGAGYGRWAVRAACAVEQFHPGMPYHVTAVEAEPVVYSWMSRHFRDNGIDPAKHSLLHGAISDTGGEVLFYIGAPKGSPWDREPNAWYGQSLTKDYDVTAESVPDGEYAGFQVVRHPSGWRSIKVPGITLARLLEKPALVDLIDMDIEGQELPAVRSNIDTLDAKVKRLHIGTHGKEIEAGLREILTAHGWSCWADYTLFSTSATPWGPISFENGVQGWVNPRL